MIEYLESLFDGVSASTAYWILGISAYVENVFPPIPGDTVTVLGAYLISNGSLDFWGVYISTTIGSVSGFFSMYLLAIKFGRPFLKTKIRARIFSEEQLKKVEVWFANYGYWVIIGNRFLSGTRSVISFFAGLFHLKWTIVLLLATLSAFIWNGLLIYAGYALGVNWQTIMEIISQYNKVFMLVLVVIVAVFVRKYYKKKKMNQEEVNE